jgi:DeoR family transcriptional regulator of aga operon
MNNKQNSEEGGFPAQRRAIILQILQDRGSASINELATEIKVSAATIRRDLDYLAENDYIERSYGGAVFSPPKRSTFKPEADIGSETAREQKQRIGQYAAQKLYRGQSVIFDASSTVLQVAHHVAQQQLPLTAVTNDLNIALTLSNSPSIRLIVPGGTLYPKTYTLTGEPGESFIGGLNIDVALIGIHALSDGWLSDTSIEITNLKRQIIQVSSYVMVLVDSRKFKTSAFRKVCSVGEIDEIITDEGISATDKQAFEERGVLVSIAT